MSGPCLGFSPWVASSNLPPGSQWGGESVFAFSGRAIPELPVIFESGRFIGVLVHQWRSLIGEVNPSWAEGEVFYQRAFVYH